MTWILAAVLVAAGPFGLYWFQPWKLFTSSTVNEALPSVEPGRSRGLSPGHRSAGTDQHAAGQRHVDHARTRHPRLRPPGRLADGRVQLTLENLATSDGPDLHVWLTDQPVIEGRDGWHVFDDGRYVELGALKANNGNQVYEVPAGTDLSGADQRDDLV